MQSNILCWSRNVRILILDKFVLGAVIATSGAFLDRILYNYLYLYKIDKAFVFKLSFEEIITFYKLPISWIGPFLIITGLFIIYFSKTNLDN